MLMPEGNGKMFTYVNLKIIDDYLGGSEEHSVL